jgi:hypothetical protein
LAVGAAAYGMRGSTFFGFLWHHRFDLAGELDSSLCIRSRGSISSIKGKGKQNKRGREKVLLLSPVGGISSSPSQQLACSRNSTNARKKS